METVCLETVDSTNSYAKQHISEYADRTVIHAFSQTSGRGRLQRSWIDLGDGNLFMTFLLKPSDTFKEVYSNLTQYLSVKLCKVIEMYGLETKIKWPNDVLVNGKKISGILSETSMAGNHLKGLALGVGVNLSASVEKLSLIKEREATAINVELGKSVDLIEFRDRLCQEFFKDYDEFLEKGFELIKADYIKRACFIGKEIDVNLLNAKLHGVAEDINDSGELVLDTKNEKVVLTIGDIL